MTRLNLTSWQRQRLRRPDDVRRMPALERPSRSLDNMKIFVPRETFRAETRVAVVRA